jgi:hypothetical protein
VGTYQGDETYFGEFFFADQTYLSMSNLYNQVCKNHSLLFTLISKNRLYEKGTHKTGRIHWAYHGADQKLTRR